MTLLELTEPRLSSRRLFSSSRSPRGSLRSELASPVVSSSRAPPELVRPSLPALLLERPVFLSSPSPALSSSRCLLVWELPGFATSSPRPRRTPLASSSSMRSTPLAVSAELVSLEETTRGSRPSIRSSLRWTASRATPELSSSLPPTEPMFLTLLSFVLAASTEGLLSTSLTSLDVLPSLVSTPAASPSAMTSTSTRSLAVPPASPVPPWPT
mmetsp:Transcript_34954/g.109282  ORF Transcript_34954/g.109282 Transcript_34954/m.109282 type:complete len:213 (+) Transcript_34954:757-1395(+)